MGKQSRKRVRKSTATPTRITRELVVELARVKWSSSGLTDKQAEALHLEPVLDKKHPRLRIPYFDIHGNPITDGGSFGGFATTKPYFRDRYLEDVERGIAAPRDEKGKARRYVQPKGTPPRAYFAQLVPWARIAADASATIYITEGELKGAAGCSVGLAVVALGGVLAFQSRKWGMRFLPELEAFTWAGRRVVIVYDSDIAHKPAVQAALKALARLLQDRGADVHEADLPPTEDGEKQGLDDFLVNEGAEALRTLLGDAGRVEDLDAPERATVATIMAVMHGAWGLRDSVLGAGSALEFNQLQKVPVLNRQPIDIDDTVLRLRVAAADAHGWTFGREDTWDTIVSVAKERSFHPVADYLNRLPAWDGRDRLEELSREVLRLPKDDALSRLLLRKFLIMAVARPMRPGCKADNVLVLVGLPGSQKSTFFKTLAGEEFFGDTPLNLQDKDSYLALHTVWVYEWAELESMRRANNATVKTFLASPRDTIRPPYGRVTESLPRSSVIVGSTNETGFLTDPTGNRRFWPIPIVASPSNPIRLDRLAAVRDQLWAQALALYRSGEPWWLTSEQEACLVTRHAEHRRSDGAEDEVVAYVDSRREFDGATSAEILSHLHRYDPGMSHVIDEHGTLEFKVKASWPKGEFSRIADILEARGYECRRRSVGGGQKERNLKWRHRTWEGSGRGSPAMKAGNVVSGAFGSERTTPAPSATAVPGQADDAAVPATRPARKPKFVGDRR